MILLAVFTGCGDGVARAYDAKSATLKRIFQGHEGAINCLVCVDDKLYTGILKKCILLFYVSTHSVLREF